MPLSPERQRERRALAKRLADPKKQRRRRRCLNDGKLFVVTVPHKRFCSDSCKKEFHKHGSAFGPLKDTITKLVQSLVGETEKKLEALLASLKVGLPAGFREDYEEQLRKRGITP